MIGGMYGTFFKQFPPAAYISFSITVSLLVAFLLASIFISKSNLINRLPDPIPGGNMLAFGGFVILLPQILRIFTSMVEGGGASFVLMNFAAPVVSVAKLVLYVGIIKLLMAVKPHESYVYQ
jgi:multidrug efflux pump subunit AcrB